MPAPAAGPFEVRNVGLKEIALVCDGEVVSLKPGQTLLARRVKFSSGAVRIVARDGLRLDLAPVEEMSRSSSQQDVGNPMPAEPLRAHRTTVIITAALTLATWSAVIAAETLPRTDVALMLLVLSCLWFGLLRVRERWSIQRLRDSLCRSFPAVIALAVCGALFYVMLRWEPLRNVTNMLTVAYFTLAAAVAVFALIASGAWLIRSKLARRH